MGEHKGWYIRTDKKTGKTRAMVSIAGTGKHRSKSFKLPADARAWARTQAAAAAGGRPTAALLVGKALVADIRDGYEASMKARGRSEAHLKNVGRTIDTLGDIAPDLAAAGAGLAIERWLDGLEGSPTTRNRKLTEVRALVRWAMKRDLIDRDPTRSIEKAQGNRKLKAQFTISELVQLLALPTPDENYRRRFAVMLYAGLRADEAAGLGWSVIDVPGRAIHVKKVPGRRLKRNKERIVPLQPELIQVLGPAGDGPVTAVGDRWNERRAFDRYLEACGIPKAGRSPHSCRHTYAALMTATHVSSFLLAEWMGHGSTGTTAGYAKLASRHQFGVIGWKPGEFRLLANLH